MQLCEYLVYINICVCIEMGLFNIKHTRICHMKYFQFSIYFIFYISFIGSAAAVASFMALAATWAAIFSKIHTIAIPSECVLYVCVCVDVCYAANSSAAAAAGDRDASLW